MERLKTPAPIRRRLPFPPHSRHSSPQHSHCPSGRASSSLHRQPGQQRRRAGGGRLASSSNAPSCQGSEQTLLHTLRFETRKRCGSFASEVHTLAKPRATTVAALASVTRFEQSLDQMAFGDHFQLQLLCDYKKAGVRKLLRKEEKKSSAPHTYHTKHTDFLFQHCQQYPPSQNPTDTANIEKTAGFACSLDRKSVVKAICLR